jgi:MFS family permease
MSASAPAEPDAENAASFAAAQPLQRRGMTLAITAQIFGMLADISFRNGILLVYFTALSLNRDRVLLYLSMPPLLMLLVRMPAAHLADHWGLRRVTVPGFMAVAAAFLMFLAAGFVEGLVGREALTAGGAAMFGVGISVASAGFMALLRRLVPSPLRGRFFGRMHVAWQSVGLVFVGACALFLSEEAPVSTYQWILVLLVAGALARAAFIGAMPEPPRKQPPARGMFRSIGRCMRVEAYAGFCAYVFLLAFFTGAGPYVLGLLEKHTLGFGDNTVVLLGNLIMVGSLVGFALGGKATDRWGTKPVFLICHFGYGLFLALPVLRPFVGDADFAIAVVAHLGYGACWAGSLLAISTELMALVPAENEAVGISFALLLFHVGSAVAGMLASAALALGMLAEAWTLWGRGMGPYDSILLLAAVMVLMLVMTLALVPSVLRKAEWVPNT